MKVASGRISESRFHFIYGSLFLLIKSGSVYFVLVILQVSFISSYFDFTIFLKTVRSPASFFKSLTERYPLDLEGS